MVAFPPTRVRDAARPRRRHGVRHVSLVTSSFRFVAIGDPVRGIILSASRIFEKKKKTDKERYNLSTNNDNSDGGGGVDGTKQQRGCCQRHSRVSPARAPPPPPARSSPRKGNTWRPAHKNTKTHKTHKTHAVTTGQKKKKKRVENRPGYELQTYPGNQFLFTHLLSRRQRRRETRRKNETL